MPGDGDSTARNASDRTCGSAWSLADAQPQALRPAIPLASNVTRVTPDLPPFGDSLPLRDRRCPVGARPRRVANVNLTQVRATGPLGTYRAFTDDVLRDGKHEQRTKSMTALQDWLSFRPVDQSVVRDMVCRPFRT